MLLGDARPPASGDGAAASVGWDAKRGADVLALPVPAGGTLQILFRGDGAARTLVAVDRLGAGGAPLWRTLYEDQETAGGARVPRTIHFAEAAGSFDDGVEINFKDRALNAPAPAGAFTLAPPAGSTVVDVGCGKF